MSAPAAFASTFSDFKVIKGRKVAQFVFEVPLENADAALAALGGLPRPDAEKWVAVALMSGPPSPKAEEKPRKRFEELPYPQQAALKCSDPAFQRFMAERAGLKDWNQNLTVDRIRYSCGIDSRAEIKPGSPAANRWTALLDEFRLWLREPSHV